MGIHVSLRPLSEEDKPRLYAWRNSPGVAEFMYTPHLITPEEHDRWWAGIPSAKDRRYWLVCAAGEPAGLTNLYDIRPEHRRASWAIYLGESRFRGMGIGSCVEYLVLREVFDGMGFYKICCEVLGNNGSAIGSHKSA